MTAQGNRKRHLEIENDEQDGDKVEAHVELHASVIESVEAAFVGGKLLGIGAPVGDEKRYQQQCETDAERDRDEDRRAADIPATARSSATPVPYRANRVPARTDHPEPAAKHPAGARNRPCFRSVRSKAGMALPYRSTQWVARRLHRSLPACGQRFGGQGRTAVCQAHLSKSPHESNSARDICWCGRGCTPLRMTPYDGNCGELDATQDHDLLRGDRLCRHARSQSGRAGYPGADRAVGNRCGQGWRSHRPYPRSRSARPRGQAWTLRSMREVVDRIRSAGATS